MQITKQEINALTSEEKQALLDMIWDSMGDNNYTDSMEEESEEELRIVQEALADYEAKPDNAISWKEAKSQIITKLGNERP